MKSRQIINYILGIMLFWMQGVLSVAQVKITKEQPVEISIKQSHLPLTFMSDRPLRYDKNRQTLTLTASWLREDGIVPTNMPIDCNDLRIVVKINSKDVLDTLFYEKLKVLLGNYKLYGLYFEADYPLELSLPGFLFDLTIHLGFKNINWNKSQKPICWTGLSMVNDWIEYSELKEDFWQIVAKAENLSYLEISGYHLNQFYGDGGFPALKTLFIVNCPGYDIDSGFITRPNPPSLILDFPNFEWLLKTNLLLQFQKNRAFLTYISLNLPTIEQVDLMKYKLEGAYPEIRWAMYLKEATGFSFSDISNSHEKIISSGYLITVY
jgi:hypothetical protein